MTVDVPWSLSGSLSFALNFNLAMIQQMENLRIDYEGGLITYEKARAQLERDVRKSYYQMLLVQENLKLLQESYASAERQEATARANYQAGLAPELTLLQAQVSKENLRPNITESENGYKLLMAQFAMNLGLPYNTEFELSPLTDDFVFVSLDVKDLIDRAASGKPDIQELRHNVEVLQGSRKALFHQTYTPTFSLNWRFAPGFAGELGKDSLFMKDGWKDQSGSFSLTLTFRLSSLLPFSSAAQSLQDIDDSMRSLNIGLAQAIQGTELEIYNTVLSLQKAQTQIEVLQQTVTLAQRSYELTEQAYRAGFQDLLQVQNAEQQLNQARVGVLAQNFTYLQGLLDLEYAIGVPFGTLSGSVK
jgi:outer membrane protein TolC